MNPMPNDAIPIAELEHSELRNIHGGTWWIGLTFSAATYLFDNRDRLVEGVEDGVDDLKSLFE